MSIRYTSKPGMFGRCIKITMPHVKLDLPLFVIFKALGITKDKDILKHIMLDLSDTEMLKLLRPSVEEASGVTTQKEALELILSHSMILGQPKDLKLSHDEELEIFAGMLKRDLLAHVS